MAKKGYKKFANEIIDNIQKKFKLFETKKLHKELFSDFEMKKEFVWKLLESGFSKEPNKEEISFLYTKEGKKFKKKELEEVIDRITNTAFFKIKKIADNKELKAAVEEAKRIWESKFGSIRFYSI